MHTHHAADADGPGRLVVVGSGWRAATFLRLAAAFPERLQVVAVVTRTAAAGDDVTRRWHVPTTRTLAEAVRAFGPEFALAAVPWASSPVVIRDAVALGLPVMTETPPAPDVAGLEALWSDVGPTGLVQVAEQYPSYPGHQARRALVDAGVLGLVSSVHVASTHQYHAMALVRALLGVGHGDAVVTALRTEFPLAHPVDRDGPTGDLTPRPSWNVLAHLDFGDGRSGIYDFTDNQWHNPLRANRIVVRGSRGEIDTDAVVHAPDPLTVRQSTLVRRQSGVDMDFEGLDLDHIAFEGAVLYRNGWKGGRLTDDEIATATLLGSMTGWVRGQGPAPYPLAEGCQDHLLALAVDTALASGRPVRTARQPWADAGVGDRSAGGAAAPAVDLDGSR